MALTVIMARGKLPNEISKELEESGKYHLVITLDPFLGIDKHKIPTGLRAMLHDKLTSEPFKGSDNLNYDGRQLSRAVALHGLIQQLEVLKPVAIALEVDICIVVTFSGKLGGYGWRQLVTALGDGVELATLGYPPKVAEKLLDSKPFDNYKYYSYQNVNPSTLNVEGNGLIFSNKKIKE